MSNLGLQRAKRWDTIKGSSKKPNCTLVNEIFIGGLGHDSVEIARFKGAISGRPLSLRAFLAFLKYKFTEDLEKIKSFKKNFKVQINGCLSLLHIFTLF